MLNEEAARNTPKADVKRTDAGFKPQQGLIFNIQRFSIHDGPGIRDLVFLKGCPLRCEWCDNPESQNSCPELSFNEDRCIKCGRCQGACPNQAIVEAEGGQVSIDRTRCDNCGRCVEACPANALKLLGEHRTIDDILKVVEQDSPFYRRSGGGITVGGGEPLMQAAFVRDLLEACRRRGLSTALETSGYAPWPDLKMVAGYLDLIFYDIKITDSGQHKRHTGVPNDMILENIKRLSRDFPGLPLIVRTPVIPGITGSEENIKDIAAFLKELRSLKAYELLSYHRFGEPKYRQLGRPYPLDSLAPPAQEFVAGLRKVAQGRGISCQ